MTTQTPPTAWDPAGPESPHPDVKVAGSPLTDPDGEPLDLVIRDDKGIKGKLLFVGGAVAALVAVGVAAFTIVGLDDADGSANAAATVAPDANQPTPETTPLSAEEKKKALKDRAIAAAANDAVPSLKTKTGPTPTPSATAPTEVSGGAGPAVSPGTAQAIAKGMLKGYGWDPKTQFGCLYNLWNKESGWRTTAGSVNGPYGIPQANPGTKMASAGPKWQTDAATQIKWGFGYIKGRYSTPCGAWSHFLANHWY
ncbi:lytic transglycosylase domain-containing protein [Actinocorallia sp. A-T 12471]|uniref:aggregation-promoting factor C-terminal-like domain-containing protein n=1 Tax=Actinocorallia sp. A-T 12471 TaxID=3089813 RepID=UPI0029D2D819|nr:lytic transglycosylase domain-containing protein [Actinocorallia sp. A-T 12471]MDX6738584.1 lytic transglycosylase domain-containing protein [Actinocorallia sp. A-T 12471]